MLYEKREKCKIACDLANLVRHTTRWRLSDNAQEFVKHVKPYKPERATAQAIAEPSVSGVYAQARVLSPKR